MSKKYIIDKDKCVSCGACVSTGGTKIGDDGKAEVINDELLEQGGGKDICPVWAVKEVEEI